MLSESTRAVRIPPPTKQLFVGFSKFNLSVRSNESTKMPFLNLSSPAELYNNALMVFCSRNVNFVNVSRFLSFLSITPISAIVNLRCNSACENLVAVL